MTADVELLPCPFCGSQEVNYGRTDYGTAFVNCSDCCAHTGGALLDDKRTREEAANDWNRRAHATAAKDAEIEALRAGVERLREVSQQVARMAGANNLAAVEAEARAERLAEALREKADKWDRIGDEHGVRQFTGNDHKLFANELRALLRDQEEGK